jgi:hypothetical protein
MPYEISKMDVWAGSIEDRPGGLAEKLEALTEAGANLEFLIARRAPDKPGTGVVFLSPLKGAKQTKTARGLGLQKAESLRSVRVEGPDKPGMCAKVATALADAGINARGVSAAALGKKSVQYFAFDSVADAGNAIRVLKKLLK